MSLAKRFVAEVVGTFILVFFGPGAAVITLMIANGAEKPNAFNIGIGALGGLGDWLAIALAFALAISAVIYSLGKISGAHINPAVTIGLWSIGKFPSGEVLPYIAAQLIGATLGSLAFLACVGEAAVFVGGLGATAPFPGVSYGQAILAEFVGTFLLMLVIMGIAVDERAPSQLAGLVIGLTVGGIIITIGNVTGSSLNPARTFGPYVGDSIFGINLWQYFPIYVIGPIAGAIAAAWLYRYLAVE